MGAVLTIRTLLIGAASATTIAVIDAALGNNWDLIVVTAVVLVLQVAALAKLGRRRLQVPLRADLARWLEDRASVTGESIESIVDRAMAGFAARLASQSTRGHPAGGR